MLPVYGKQMLRIRSNTDRFKLCCIAAESLVFISFHRVIL